METVGKLFERVPDDWGLRGDEFLWHELESKLASVELPSTEQSLQRLLETAFWEATATSLAFCDEVFVQRFSHGGMSSGYISGDFWRERGFPLIVNRFLEANHR